MATCIVSVGLADRNGNPWREDQQQRAARYLQMQASSMGATVHFAGIGTGQYTTQGDEPQTYIEPAFTMVLDREPPGLRAMLASWAQLNGQESVAVTLGHTHIILAPEVHNVH